MHRISKSESRRVILCEDIIIHPKWRQEIGKPLNIQNGFDITILVLEYELGKHKKSNLTKSHFMSKECLIVRMN